MTLEDSRDKLCLALDVDTKKEALTLVDSLSQYVGYFKVGLQLFTSYGPEIVEIISRRGSKVFLDLKFHDIPNTVANASRVATQLGVSIFNLHVAGGVEMMKRTAEIVGSTSSSLGIEKPKILGITVLTSIDETVLRDELCVDNTVENHVRHLANLTQSAGLDGIVCSAKEVKKVREACGKDFFLLTPGIRPLWAVGKDDQKRVVTPFDAVKNGSDLIVIGRPLRCADDPKKAAKDILQEISEAI